MTDQRLTYRDDRKQVGAVLSNFTVAFDVIDHSILIAKLKGCGCSPLALSPAEHGEYFSAAVFSDRYKVSSRCSPGEPLGSTFILNFHKRFTTCCKKCQRSYVC